MMAGAAATLAAQWGLIPRLGLGPRSLILWGALIAAAGLIGTMLAADLYGITLGFAVPSLGFGFTRPGFTAGASLAVPLAEQGGGRRRDHLRQRHQLRRSRRRSASRSTASIHDLPFAAFAVLLLGLAPGRPAGRLADLASSLPPALRPQHAGEDEADAAHRPHRVALQRLLDPLIFLEHFRR